ncbi:MAG: sulfatase-like hydrolase/transferase [Candidatus Aminicenantes bacterium]|nr:sulfatase-like hydrolase/transferase [Candidatus Aminicenantes bacterium]
MNRTRLQKQILFLSLAGLLIFSTSVKGAELNLLLITIDTLRPDRLSCYNSPYVKTPQIDALAAKGVLFERAFAHDPLTLPSHVNILLGMTSLAHGVNENSKSVVAPEFETLAELLKSEGYSTGAFVGAFPLDSRFGLNQGFDVYDDFYPSHSSPGKAYNERPAEKTIQPALDWLSQQNEKWFCWIHIWDPHFPYSPPEPFATQFKEDPYSGEVAYVDQEIGKLLELVENKGWAEQTSVILTGDHGESLGEHGELTHSYFAYNSTIWIPLIITVPKIKASRVEDFVSHVDIFPTVCDVLGIKKPSSLHGESLDPYLRGRTRKNSDPIYFEAMNAYETKGWAPLRGLILDGKKYFDSPIPELYDLEKDFNEETNLASATNTASFKKKLEEIKESYSLPPQSQAQSQPNRDTLARLRSLGYVSAPVSQMKDTYGPEDDLKTLLPLEQKYDLATSMRKDGNIPESVKLLDDIIKARKDFIKAYDLLYQIYISQGLLDEGLKILERGFLANPDNYMAISGYGIALIKQGKQEKGAQFLEEAITLFDKDTEVWDLLGVAYWILGDLERAQDRFEKALELDPEDAVVNVNAGSFFMTMAKRTKSPPDILRAVRNFRTAVASDPYLASARNGLGGALKMAGNNDEAIAHWERALEIDPSYALSAYNLAVVYLEKGEKIRALEYCQKYLSIKGKTLTSAEKKDIDQIIEECKK